MQRHPKYGSVKWFENNKDSEELVIRVSILHHNQEGYLCRPVYGDNTRIFTEDEIFDQGNKLGMI